MLSSQGAYHPVTRRLQSLHLLSARIPIFNFHTGCIAWTGPDEMAEDMDGIIYTMFIMFRYQMDASSSSCLRVVSSFFMSISPFLLLHSAPPDTLSCQRGVDSSWCSCSTARSMELIEAALFASCREVHMTNGLLQTNGRFF